MAVNADTTYSLSNETGLGVELCKIALERAKNDVVEAKRTLERWSGQTLKNKSTIFGLVCTFFEKEYDAGAVVEVQCTDEIFSNSKEFYELTGEIATEVVRYEHHYVVEPRLPEIESRNNCQISVKSARFVKTSPLCLLTTYTHRDRIGVIVETEVENEEAMNNKLFKAFSFDLALHIAAFEPFAIDKNDISKEMRAELTSQIEKELSRNGKPLQLWATITDGKITKWAEQRSLLNQIFIKSDKDTVAEVKTKLAEKIGSDITIKRFERFALGTK